MIGNPTRPGDLAEVIAGGGDFNIGRRVLVLKVLADGERLIKPLQPLWSGARDFDVSDGLSMENGRMWDDFLKPIRPPAPEEQDERVEHLVGVV